MCSSSYALICISLITEEFEHPVLAFCFVLFFFCVPFLFLFHFYIQFIIVVEAFYIFCILIVLGIDQRIGPV